MLLIPKQNQLPKLMFLRGYLFVNISFKTAMTILLMLLVDVEWLFASLCLSSLVIGPCFQNEMVMLQVIVENFQGLLPPPPSHPPKKKDP